MFKKILIANGIRRSRDNRRATGSILPKLACPACWPAYAGLLSSVGLGFLISAVYLLPLTIAFLVMVLWALAYRARDRHGYGPLFIGLIAAFGVLAGKFAWSSNTIVYGAVGLLVTASLWNAWPRRRPAVVKAVEENSY